MKNIYYYLAALLGEVIILGVCFELKPLLGENVTYLNAAVLTLIYLLCWVRFFVPLIDKDDNAESWVGSLGVKLVGIQFLLVVAVLIMFGSNIQVPTYQVPWRYQLYMHIAAFAIFFLIMAFSEESASKVKEVYIEEQTKIRGIEAMRSDMQNLLDEIELGDDIPIEIKNKFGSLNNELRYISPNNSAKAYEIEMKFCNLAQSLILTVQSGYKLNADSISKSLSQLSLYLKKRKEVRD